MRKTMKTLRDAIPFVAVAAIALGSLATPLAQATTFIVNGAPGNTLTFCGSSAASQQISITTDTGSSPFSVGFNSLSNWLSVGPTSGTAISSSNFPISVVVNGNASGFATGTYPGTITISPPNGSNIPAVNISATLYIGSCPTGSTGTGVGLSSNPASLTFTSSFSQNLLVTNTSGLSNVTVFAFANNPSGQNWLSVSPSASSALAAGFSATFQVTVSTVGLVFGNTYTGSINFSSTANGSLMVPVTLNFGTAGGGNSTILTANQTSLSANLNFPSSAVTQGLNITNSSSGTVTVASSATTSTGQNWLSVIPTNQPIPAGSNVQFVVKIDPSALASGTYSGTLSFNPNNGTGVLNVPVTLTYGTGGGGGGGNGVLVVNPSPAVGFSVLLGLGSPASNQQLTIQNTSTVADTISVQTSENSGVSQNWLRISPTGIQTIGAGVTVLYGVTIDPTGLTFGATYTGTITISDQSGSGGTILIPVTLCYGTTGCTGAGGTASLTATLNPSPINIPAGTQTPVSATLTVTSLVGPVNITASASANFLTVNPAFSATSSNNSTVTLTVTVTPSLVPTGVTSGSVTLVPSSGNPLVVSIPITIGATPNLTITPSQLSFAYQTGTAFPPPQNLTLSSSTVTGFTASATTTSGGNWLVVSPLSGATAGGGVGTTVTVSINPSGLPASSYSGQITITNTSSGTSQNIPVTLLVSNLPLLSFGNSGTTFNYQFQSTTLPTQQTVQLTSSGNPLTFSATVSPVSGGNFLTVTPASGTTPQTLALSLNASVLAQLAPGTYTSNVVVAAPGAGSSPVTYPVTLNITNNVLLNASQTSLNFNFQVGQSQPSAQTINIVSTGQPLSFTVTAAANGSTCPNFLSASPASGTTNSTIAVTVNTASLPVGTCTGQISIASSGAGNSPLNIPVNLYVSNSALLNVSPSAINVTTQVGTNPPNLTIPLTSTDPNNQLTFNVTIAPNSNFILVGPTNGATPTNLTVGFNTSGLPAGTYTSSINIVATGVSTSTVANSPVTIPVTVVVASGATASTSPTSLTFNQAFGGAAPPSQTLQVTSTTPGLTFSATGTTFNGGNWLTVATTNSVTPGSVTVSANGAILGQGTYSGVITIVMPGAANSPLNVPVTLVIGPAQSLTVNPGSLTFSYQAGSTITPQPQTVQVGSTSGSVVFSAAASTSSGTPNFLTVSPAGGTTPSAITVGLNQSVIATLAAGNYSGTITLTAPNAANQVISVTLTVAPTPPPGITSLANAASLQPGAVAPGEIITIFGTNLGPATGVGLTLTASGMVSTSLGNTQVLFDSTPAPLIFVRADQVNAIVPYEIAGRLTTNVTILRNGVTSTALQQRVVDTSPSIFSLNATSTGSGTGSGQGAILNQNGSVNGINNPAAKGTVISIYATGEGALTPGVPTGSVTSTTGPTFPKPIGNVTVTIGGIPATIAYEGEAPGLVSGVLQVNAFIPTSVASGNQTVVLTVGSGTNSQQAITVAVQ